TRLHVDVRENARIEEIRADKAILADGAHSGFDGGLWARGFPAGPRARAAGLPCNARGQIVVDDTLRVPSHPEVFVAGDAAEVSVATGETLRMACATAMPMGAHAGEQLARAIRGGAPLPLAYAFVIRCVSLGRQGGLIQHVDEVD